MAREGIKVRAIAASDKEEGRYALFGDGRLFAADVADQSLTELAPLPNIQTISHGLGDGRSEGKELEVSLAYHHPYICVTERFGVNAALYSLETGAVRELRREDYHCDVSSYSVGFLEREGRVLLIIQTQWNRLDILDAETGENLTEREVYYRETGEKKADGSPVFESKNYLDYFHSRIHVSPDSKHFLSNGWVWSPCDMVVLFETAGFFRDFERSGVNTACSGDGYNWDRPCAFIDDDLFVVVADDAGMAGGLSEEEKATYQYRQLVFYRVSGKRETNSYGYSWLEPYKEAACRAFTPYEYGEVRGLLYYDKAKAYLVAITPEGAFALGLSGEILARLPGVTAGWNTGSFPLGQTAADPPKDAIEWDYSPDHHVFYAWKDGVGIVEERFA